MGGIAAGLPGPVEWATTALGTDDAWPPALRVAASLVANHQGPAWLAWGPTGITIVNAPLAALCVGPVPQGQPAAAIAGEPWAFLAAVDHGRDHRVVLERNGFAEERFFTVSSLPVPGDDGSAGGVVTLLTETTERVREHRRDHALHRLASEVAGRPTVADVCTAAAGALAAAAADLPSVAIYRIDPLARVAHRAAVTGLPPDAAAAPATIRLAGPPTGWPLARVVESGQGEIVTEPERLGFPDGPDRPGLAVALPIRVGDDVVAVVCAGIARTQRLDAELRSFLDRAVADLATAITVAGEHEQTVTRADALATLDTKKTRFFVDVTHEFRTPLMLLTSAIEDALIEVKDPMQRDRLRMAHRNLQRLHKLVNNLLDFARIEANQIRAAFAPTDLARLTREVVASFEPICAQTGIRLTVDCPPMPEPIYVDPTMWEKIVLNLLSNAFKHTFLGSIEVVLRARDEVVELAVNDTGIGIAEDHLPRVFDRFYRVEGARARSAEGTGIGLAMVKELAAWHGGTVAAESTKGIGSQFRVTVKRGTAHLPVAQIDRTHALISRTTRDAYIEDARQWIVDDLADRVPEGPLGTRPRVLWAEDNADMRAYVRKLLAKEFEVVAVSNGKSALDAIKTKPFDLVLADVMMPGMSGLALLDAIRADDRDRATPVVLVSGRSGDDAAIEAFEHGADEYLTKPVSLRRLVAAVRAHLELTKLRRGDSSH